MTSVLRQTAINPRDLWAPATILILALIVLWACTFGAFDYDGSSLNIMFGFNVLIYAAGVVMWLARRESRIGQTTRAFGMFGAMTLLTLLVSAVLGRGNTPYIDGTLEAVDRAMFWGFNWPRVNAALATHPRIVTALSYAYISLNWQPVVLFAVMAFERSNTEISSFIASWSLALLACVLPFAWLPALGAYTHFGIPFSKVHGLIVHLPWEYPLSLEAVRNGSIHTLGRQSIVGLVTVPSFHACAATLLAWGFHKVPVLRWPFGLLNILMFISAVPVGGHYLTDVVAGFLVAAAAIAISTRRPSARLKPEGRPQATGSTDWSAHRAPHAP